MDLIPLDQLDAGALPAFPGRRGELVGAALEAYRSLDLPDETDELWRYTDISNWIDLDRLSLPVPESGAGPPEDGSTPPRSERSDSLANLRTGAAIENARVAIVANGVVGRDGVTLERIGAAGDDPQAWQLTDPNRDKFTALAAATGDGVCLSISEGVVVEAPILIRVSVTEQSIAAPALITVRLGEAAEASVVVLVEGDAAGSLVLPVTELHLGPGSTLYHVELGLLGPDTVQIASTGASLERDAHLRTAAVGLGGSLTRLNIVSAMEGEGSESEMLGAFFGDGKQHFDYRTFQDHRAPRTQSDLLYKGAVDGRASSVYSGLIRVEKDAQKIVGFQVNRNLVLSDEASAESIPNLEILANDVRCSHASATGPLDEDQLFYLESRGISPEVAERILVEGFFEEVISRLPVADVVPPVRDAIKKKYSGHGETDA